MSRYFLLALFFLNISLLAHGQSFSIQPVDNSAANSVTTFSLSEGKVRFEPGQLSFLDNRVGIANFRDIGVTPDQTMVSAIQSGRKSGTALLMNSVGDTLISYATTGISSSDPSVALYASNTGSILVRDNIANFNFYNPLGKVITNVSGSSQSKGGETISEVAMDPQWRTIVIYVPKIKREDNIGSQAKYLNENNELKSLFFSTDRSIKNLSVTDNGQFITVVTNKPGTDDMILIMDRFGNEMNTISSDEELAGAQLSEDAQVVTAYSEKRVLVLDAMSGERLGSTSFRSPVVLVNYFPEDEVLLTMTGSYSESTGIVNNVEFHAIDLGRRKVERKDYDSALGFNKAIVRKFTRTGRHDYLLQGANKKLRIRVSF